MTRQQLINGVYLKKIPLWLLPLLLSLLFFQVMGVKTSPDSAWYVVKGLNLYHGLGYVNADWRPDVGRGPIFPGLIALSFSIFGVSLQSALWVNRLFFVLNTVLVYATGATLFNRTTGLMASLLVATSFVIHKWSSFILVDNVVPFFILLAHLLLFIAFERKSNLYFGLAGASLGIGFLTKEITVLFLPLPALLWLLIPAYRTRRAWWGIFIFWGIVLATISSWFMYVYAYGDGSDPTVDRAMRQSSALFSPVEGDIDDRSWLWEMWFKEVGGWISNYYRALLERNFVLAPLIVLAWGYISFRAIVKRSRAEIVLLSSLVLFSPLIILQGRTDLRTGQSFYVFLLCYLILARLLWPPAIGGRKGLQVISGSLLLLVIAAQIWLGDRALIQIIRGQASEIYAISFGRNEWQVSGEHETVREAGEWLRENSKPGEAILMDGKWSNALYFYLNARQPIHRISYISSNVHVNAHQPIQQKYYFAAPEDIYFFKQYPMSPILFVWSQRDRTDPSYRKSWLNALSEPEFLTQIQALRIKYVVVNQHLNFFSLYLEANSDFEAMKQFNDGAIKIFKVRENVGPSEFPTHFEPSAFMYLRRSAGETPALYERLVNDYIVKVLGIDKSSVEKVVSDPHLIVRAVQFEQLY
jgi:hypothetical protein